MTAKHKALLMMAPAVVISTVIIWTVIWKSLDWFVAGFRAWKRNG